MIQIEDNDLPITVAQKIISGTRPVSPMTEKLQKAICGESAKTGQDMFDIDEIKEIADYLMVFYETHKEND